jgi:hypothetical protein
MIWRMSDGCEPYEEITSDELGERAAERMSYSFEPEDEPEDVVITGPCPRCAGAMTYMWPLVVVRDLIAAERTETLQITVVCRCGGTHAGAGSEVGCGAYWMLSVPRPG